MKGYSRVSVILFFALLVGAVSSWELYLSQQREAVLTERVAELQNRAQELSMTIGKLKLDAAWESSSNPDMPAIPPVE